LIAEKALRTLKVKMTIERRAKEAEAEMIRLPLREALEQEVVSWWWWWWWWWWVIAGVIV